MKPKCLILSWLVVLDEKGVAIRKGVAFYYSIQKSSLLLGSAMKMVQASCSDVPRPATQCMLRLFANAAQVLEDMAHSLRVLAAFRGLEFGSQHTHQVA